MNQRAQTIVDSFASVIKPNKTIIDIGAGKGLLAEEMARRFNARVTMVDVAKYNQSHLLLTVCDSRALAFADNSFDYALLSFVLHHTPKPELILREALRVAREVVVIENDVRSKLRGIVTQLIDSYPAIRYGTPPCHFTKTKDEWMKLFATFSVQAHIVNKFSLELGFFQNFATILTKDGEQKTNA